MYVIRLPNGNLQVPRSAIHERRIFGDAYVEIGPQDADYDRLEAQAVTVDELERRQAQWAAGDEALRREFLEFARLADGQGWPGPPAADQSRSGQHRPGQRRPGDGRPGYGRPGQASGPDTD
jgi:hypothetical protein